MMKRCVCIESPYRGISPEERARNIEYAKACKLDSLMRGEAPFLSHDHYTDVLDDDKSDERAVGMAAGHAWMLKGDAIVAYGDRGISEGMKERIRLARSNGVQVEPVRLLGGPWTRRGTWKRT